MVKLLGPINDQQDVVNLAEISKVYVYDEDTDSYVEVGRLFIGPEDPTDDGFTGQAGDAWTSEFGGGLSEEQADELYAPITYGTFSRRVRQTLTNKTSWSGTADEQWGTEEATFDDALLPKLTDVTAFAEFFGNVYDDTTTSPLNIIVEISLDGGATWASGTNSQFRRLSGGNASNRTAISGAHQVTGTVTGDVQARVVANTSGGAGASFDLMNGVIYLNVLVSP